MRLNSTRLSRTYAKVQERNRHESYLSYIEISIVEHCNLNCARCSNFSPLAEEHFADLTIFENSIKKLSKISNKRVDEVRLIGGEPLLNPNLIKYFEILKQYLPRTHLSIFTNGILLPKQTNLFFEYLKDNKIEVFISDYYGGQLKQDIIALGNKFNILSQIVFITSQKNNKMFNNLSIDIRGSEDSVNNYESCSLGRTCLHMKDNIIYICPILAHIEHFNKYFNESLTLTSQDFIDINNLSSLKELINFLNERKDNAFCKNCNLKSRDSKLFKMKHTEYNIYEWYYKQNEEV